VDIIKELKKFLVSEVAIGFEQSKQSIEPDDDLITSGLIDSMGILKLAAFMEKKFGIKITDDDMLPDNFRSIDCLHKFIELKRKK
jgi:acyl carrier protein